METPDMTNSNTGARAVEILAAMLEEAEADLAEAKAEKEAGTADAYYVDMRQSAVNALHDAHSAVRRAAHGRPATAGYAAEITTSKHGRWWQGHVKMNGAIYYSTTIQSNERRARRYAEMWAEEMERTRDYDAACQALRRHEGWAA